MDVLPEFRRNGKLLRRPTGRKRGESYDVVFPHASLGIALALALDDGGTQVVALDAKGPSLHPAAQLACDVGDSVGTKSSAGTEDGGSVCHWSSSVSNGLGNRLHRTCKRVNNGLHYGLFLLLVLLA